MTKIFINKNELKEKYLPVIINIIKYNTFLGGHTLFNTNNLTQASQFPWDSLKSGDSAPNLTLIP